MTEATEETTNQIFNMDIPLSDGSKRIDDGILEIIGHYTLDELEADYSDARSKGNLRKESILEFVLNRLVYNKLFIDRIMVSTYNNLATFSVEFKEGYTMQMSIDDMSKAIKKGINPKLGKLNLETLEIE